jgi:di/tricarboxylate transporter
MTPEIATFTGILVVAMVLFAIEWIAADVVAIGVLLALILTGLLTPEAAFAGFGSNTVIMILGLLILSAALKKTGVIELAGFAIVKLGGDEMRRLFAVIVIATTCLSAFISNTAATAFFLPLVMGVATRAGISPSRLLMPLAFAAISASSLTLIATSANLVVSGLMTQHGLAPLGLFELTAVGAPIAAASGLYMVTMGRRLTPERAPPGNDTDRFELKSYLTEVLIPARSPLIGKTIEESGLGDQLDLVILAVVRGDERMVGYRPTIRLASGDVLLVEGLRDNILKLKDRVGVEIKPEITLPTPNLEAGDTRLVEVILMPGSPLIGASLKSQRFRQRYGLQVLAINRHDGVLRSKLSEVRLRLGDVLLVQGHRAAIADLDDQKLSRVIGIVPTSSQRLRRAPIAILAFAGAILCASIGLMPFSVAALLGALVVFATGCITPEEAYREVQWRVVILIACMLAVGAAMQTTGAAAFFAAKIVGVTSSADPRMILGGFFLLTVGLTQPMSNQTAAAVIVPIAIQTAVALGLDPRAFAIVVAVAASCSFLTPLEPACLLVYGPGRYRVRDFLKVGTPLTILIFVIVMALVPIIWPLRAG